jgi:hypothetical protein
MPKRTTSHPAVPVPRHSRRVLDAATRLELTLAVLAGTLGALGESTGARFAALMGQAEPVSCDPAAAADWAIGLVHAVFQEDVRNGQLTRATKGVGNAARNVQRVLAWEAARDASIALREATPLPVKASGKAAAKKLAA